LDLQVLHCYKGTCYFNQRNLSSYKKGLVIFFQIPQARFMAGQARAKNVQSTPICLCVRIAAYFVGFTMCLPRPTKCAAIALAIMPASRAEKSEGKKLKPF
jgi:hypothetical protein